MNTGQIPVPSRRTFLASVGTLSLSGCLGSPIPRTGGQPDITVYVGSYHWGFVVLDQTGSEHEEVVLDPRMRVRIVAFNMGAKRAISQLPQSVRSSLPDHETLEERNEDRIPEPPSGDMHGALNWRTNGIPITVSR